MKVKWREFEYAFVGILCLAKMVIANRDISLVYDQLDAYKATFRSGGTDLNILYNLITPRILQYTLPMLAYIGIHFLAFPLVKKIALGGWANFNLSRTVKALGALSLITGLWVLGSTWLTYLAKPHLFNYGGYTILAMLGYNDAPLDDWFFGTGRALNFVFLLLFIAFLREAVIDYIERPVGKREFRVLVTNNIVGLTYLYLAGLFILHPIHEVFLMYVAMVTPVIALYLYTNFWLFPTKGEDLLRWSRIWRLLVATIIGSSPHLSFYIFDDNQPAAFFYYWAFLLFIATPIFWFVFQYRKEYILKMRGMEQALVQSAADLQFLRSQINPHFLFNVLNTLYGTALRERAQGTAEGIQKLGDMMRFMLHENHQDFIPMQKEMAYLKNYIDLQKLRVQASSNIQLEDNIGKQNCEQQIAPMLLIPFVENAFKHGISLQGKSWIHIHLTCSDKTLNFTVKNSIHVRREHDPEQYASGIGLKNVVERLKLLYPDQYELDYGAVGNEFVAELTLRLNNGD
jgi:two-component system, LytTR family, sensor kinase